MKQPALVLIPPTAGQAPPLVIIQEHILCPMDYLYYVA